MRTERSKSRPSWSEESHFDLVHIRFQSTLAKSSTQSTAIATTQGLAADDISTISPPKICVRLAFSPEPEDDCQAWDKYYAILRDWDA